MKNILIESIIEDKKAYVYLIYNKSLKTAYVGSSWLNIYNRYNYNKELNQFDKEHHSNFALDNALILNEIGWKFKILHIADYKYEMKALEFFYIELIKSLGFKMYNNRTGDYNKSIEYIKEDVKYTDNELFVINKVKESIKTFEDKQNVESNDYIKKFYGFQITNLKNRLNYMKVNRWALNKIKDLKKI